MSVTFMLMHQHVATATYPLSPAYRGGGGKRSMCTPWVRDKNSQIIRFWPIFVSFHYSSPPETPLAWNPAYASCYVYLLCEVSRVFHTGGFNFHFCICVGAWRAEHRSLWTDRYQIWDSCSPGVDSRGGAPAYPSYAICWCYSTEFSYDRITLHFQRVRSCTCWQCYGSLNNNARPNQLYIRWLEELTTMDSRKGN